MRWIHESPATWDADKRRIVGGADAGIFDSSYRDLALGTLVPGEWWHVELDGRVVGFGWLDVVWGDAEILLATDPEVRQRGVGAFVLEQLENEARACGVHYLYNVVRSSHPRGDEVAAWFRKHGFRAGEDGRLLRSVVRSIPPPSPR